MGNQIDVRNLVGKNQDFVRDGKNALPAFCENRFGTGKLKTRNILETAEDEFEVNWASGVHVFMDADNFRDQ